MFHFILPRTIVMEIMKIIIRNTDLFLWSWIMIVKLELKN